VPAGAMKPLSVARLAPAFLGRPVQKPRKRSSGSTGARHRALQVALVVTVLAGLAGLLISFRPMACQIAGHRAPASRSLPAWAPGPRHRPGFSDVEQFRHDHPVAAY